MVWQCTPQRALVPFAVSAGAQPPPVWRRRLTPPPSSHLCLPLGGKVSRSDGRGEWGNAKANASPPLPSPRGEGGTSRLRRVTDEGRRQTQNPAPLFSRLRRQLPPRGKPRQNRGRAALTPPLTKQRARRSYPILAFPLGGRWHAGNARMTEEGRSIRCNRPLFHTQGLHYIK